MQKIPLENFYCISKFQHHEKVKSDLLDLIYNSDYQSPYHPSTEVNISKCDWHRSTDFNRSWFLFLKSYLFDQLLEDYKQLGYDGFVLCEIWFQQYLKNSEHGWHTHSGNFTSVYYLELPDDSPKIQIISPFDQKTVIDIPVQEGDILMFPSFVIHKSPLNQSTHSKTIISFNTNVTYSDLIYNNKLGDN